MLEVEHGIVLVIVVQGLLLLVMEEHPWLLLWLL